MPANESAPVAPVVPMLVCADVVQTIDWLCRTFGFQERLRAERNGVIGHAQLKAAGGDIMLTRAGGPLTSPASGHVHHCVCVTVDDADAHFERARAAGAVIIQPPENTPFGTRQYVAADLNGHWWTFSQNVADVPPAAWGATVRAE